MGDVDTDPETFSGHSPLNVDEPETAHAVAQHLDRLMRRVGAGLDARMPQVDTAGVGRVGTLILMTLIEIEPAPIQTLARRMARDKSQMTRAIRMLAGKGMLVRCTSPADARVSLLSVTQKGRDHLLETRGVLSQLVEATLANLEPQERRQLAQLLAKID